MHIDEIVDVTEGKQDGVLCCYLVNGGKHSVPLDSNNKDYQTILAWDAITGNTITPAV